MVCETNYDQTFLKPSMTFPHVAETSERPLENKVKRCIVMKKPGFDPLAQDYLRAFRDFLEIPGVEEVRTGVRYDIEGVDGATFEQAKRAVLSEAPVNDLYSQEHFDHSPEWEDWHEIRIETLPGQYDQRADSAMQCLQLLTAGDRPPVKVANIIMVRGRNLFQEAVQK